MFINIAAPDIDKAHHRQRRVPVAEPLGVSVHIGKEGQQVVDNAGRLKHQLPQNRDDGRGEDPGEDVHHTGNCFGFDLEVLGIQQHCEDHAQNDVGHNADADKNCGIRGSTPKFLVLEEGDVILKSHELRSLGHNSLVQESLLKTGNIYNTEFAYGEVPLKYDVFDFDTYQSNPMDFYVVCTDIETGQAVYHNYGGKDDHCFDWIRASASMPLVSQIVEIAGQKLLDGGIADSIPAKYFESIGYDRNVAVLTQPAHYEKTQNRLMPLIRQKYRDYPKLVEAMASRHLAYNQTLAYIEAREKQGKLFVIRPKEKLRIGRVEKNPDKLKEIYDIGRETAASRIDEMIKYLNA